MKFIKFMSGAHLNGQNITLYRHDNGTAELVAEDIIGRKELGSRNFISTFAAEDWYRALPGSGLGRLDNALIALEEDKV